ncbi:hypothetical protein [Candidatus Chlamydia sanziniae]|uniref:hypothetical protein n=1 Tax=Candidatus Chlamydia sanziniae TaxID=1806891 RepID=UPI00082B8141|nr:hypothetical protein [Candidatus Chlamydia sanziniae]
MLPSIPPPSSSPPASYSSQRTSCCNLKIFAIDSGLFLLSIAFSVLIFILVCQALVSTLGLVGIPIALAASIAGLLTFVLMHVLIKACVNFVFDKCIRRDSLQLPLSPPPHTHNPHHSNNPPPLYPNTPPPPYSQCLPRPSTPPPPYSEEPN